MIRSTTFGRQPKLNGNANAYDGRLGIITGIRHHGRSDIQIDESYGDMSFKTTIATLKHETKCEKTTLKYTYNGVVMTCLVGSTVPAAGLCCG